MLFFHILVYPLDRIVSRHILSGSLTSNSCSAALTCVFVLRDEFAFSFQTFSRSDPPGKAALTRGRYVFQKVEEKRRKKKFDASRAAFDDALSEFQEVRRRHSTMFQKVAFVIFRKNDSETICILMIFRIFLSYSYFYRSPFFEPRKTSP